MARGRIDVPDLDDRTWQDLVDQAKALVATYAPQWTDLGPSDPGVILIELFAWLVETMIYRLNRVPEKNFIAFLNLLGITRKPAEPAWTMLTYSLPDKSTVPVVLEKGTQAATTQTEEQPAIVFETEVDLRVLPVNLVEVSFKSDGDDAKCPLQDLTEELVGISLDGKTKKRISGHTFSLGNVKSVQFQLGFDALAQGEEYLLNVRLKPPKWVGSPTLTLQTWGPPAAGKTEPDAKLRPVSIENDGTGGLLRTGAIRFKAARDWPLGFPGKDPHQKKRYWLFLNFAGFPADAELEIEYLLFNSVPAQAVLTVEGEKVGTGNGKPFQSFELAERPLYKDVYAANPYGHLKLAVGGENWQLVEAGTDWQFRAGARSDTAAAAVYRLDPVTGTIYFGSATTPEPGAARHSIGWVSQRHARRASCFGRRPARQGPTR